MQMQSEQTNSPAITKLECVDPTDEIRLSICHDNDEKNCSASYEKSSKKEEENNNEECDGQELIEWLIMQNPLDVNTSNVNSNSQSHVEDFNPTSFPRIMDENEKQLQWLKMKKEKSKRVIKKLLLMKDEIKKKLDEVCQEMEFDKQYEDEQIKNLQCLREQRQRFEVIRKEKEMIEKQKEGFKKINDLLLLQQEQQEQFCKSLFMNNGEFGKLWKCLLCDRDNPESQEYCRSCQANKIPHELLTLQGILNDNSWRPCAERQYGWVLQNQSNFPFKIKVKLERVVGSGGKEIMVCEEGILMTYEIEAHGEICVVVNARAPSLCGKYITSWQMMTIDNRKIGPRLDMKLIVKSNLNSTHEKKVKQIINEFGFDRNLVVAALSANDWNINYAMHTLLDASDAK